MVSLLSYLNFFFQNWNWFFESALFLHLFDIWWSPFSVVKMKFKSVKRRSLRGRKVNTVYKTWKRNGDFRKLRKPRLQLEADHQCCSKWIQTHSRRQRFLVMGKNLDNRLVPTFIVPWSRDKVRAIVAPKICIAYSKHWKSYVSFQLSGQTGPILGLKRTFSDQSRLSIYNQL
jgi:hypothetical protein